MTDFIEIRIMFDLEGIRKFFQHNSGRKDAGMEEVNFLKERGKLTCQMIIFDMFMHSNRFSATVFFLFSYLCHLKVL